jgi:hypothetical protein
VAVCVDWDADHFAEKVKTTVEKEDETSASNVALENTSNQQHWVPCNILSLWTDMATFLVWLLPDILSRRQVCKT